MLAEYLSTYKCYPCICSTKTPVCFCISSAVTPVTNPTITALAAINPVCYATTSTTIALAGYATTSVAIILASYATISIAIIATDT